VVDNAGMVGQVDEIKEEFVHLFMIYFGVRKYYELGTGMERGRVPGPGSGLP